MSVKRLLQIVAALVCAAMVLGWLRSRPSHYLNLPPTANGPWVAFGDSLTEGVGAAGGNDYPTLLGRALGLTITNLGRSGHTTADGLARLDEIASLQPHVVLLCLGGNDSLNGQPRRETFTNLAAIIDRLHREGSFVVLIGVHSASLRDRNEEHFARLAREKQVFYVPDILKGVLFKPVYMADAIHPNDAGYQRIAERLEKLLTPLLPKLKSTSAVN
jgi:lysophospholipase L1-like esterase